MAGFEPKIVAFLCNWCAYGGADLAGVSRMQYPANLRTIRVMCSGRVDPVFILKAFKGGYDGALVAGWHFGDCHYLEGNYHAEKKIQLTQQLLDLTGIGRERLHLYWVSSAEAQRFKDIATNVSETVKSLGKFDPKPFERELLAAEMIFNDKTMRWLVGKERPITTKGDVYGRSWTVEKYEAVLSDMLLREYQKNLIYLAVKEGCKSVRDISQLINLDIKRVSYLLADLEHTKRVEFKCFEDRKPVFAVV